MDGKPLRIILWSIMIMTLIGCRSPIRNVTATRTAQTEDIELAVIATLAAPTPVARIVQPEFIDGEGVPTDVKVVIEYRNIPTDRFLWIVVRVPKVKPNWQVYPQLQEGIPKPVIGDGTLETSVGLGGENDAGQLFNIVVLLLNEDADRLFREYGHNCIDNGICGGIPLLDSGVNLLDFTTVVRK